ncbi:MAG TPA: MFS transporter [Kiloniellales bacterium]
MKSTRASITTLLVGTAVLILGHGMLVTLLPLRAKIEVFSTTMIGVMGGAYFAGFAIGCLIGPGVVKRVGHIRAFAGFAAIAAVLVLVLPMAIDTALWTGVRGLTGICFAILFMVIESWLNDQSSNEIRGRVLSIYIIVTNLVTMGGQLLVNLSDPAGPVLFTVAAILVCLSLVPLSLTPTTTPKPIAEAKLRITQLYTYSPSGFVGCLAIGLADGAFWSLAPIFADGRGFPVADITFVMSLFVVGGSISQWPLGHYSDKIDRRWVIAFVCAGSVCTASALAVLDLDQRWLAYALACAHGAFMLPIYPLLLAHTNDYAPTSLLVETSSGLLLLYAIGAIAGPSVAAPMMQAYGVGSLFLFIAVILGLLLAYILYRLGRRPIAAPEERVEFYPVPKTSPSVYSLETDD